MKTDGTLQSVSKPRLAGVAAACVAAIFALLSFAQTSTSSSTAPAGTPRFINYQSPAGVADSVGEPSIGSNWTRETISHNHNPDGSTNNIPNGGTSLFFGGFSPAMAKVTWDDCSSPAGAVWDNKPLLSANTPRAAGDPILFTLHDTGRTFVAQLEGLTPAGSTIDITDDDGDSFTPTDGVIPSDIDHETLGGGIYHSPLPNPGPLYPEAVYYASQSVTDARAFRSDDGGILFSQAAAPMFTIADCAGLHGHVKVSPVDGTLYVPDKGCGGTLPFHEASKQAVVVSEDNGITWSVRPTRGSRGLTTPMSVPQLLTAALFLTPSSRRSWQAILTELPLLSLAAKLTGRISIVETAKTAARLRRSTVFGISMSPQHSTADKPGSRKTSRQVIPSNVVVFATAALAGTCSISLTPRSTKKVAL